MKAEQQQLLQKAEVSIRAARLLFQDGIYDVAVSRAYYAMFYVAEAFLLSADLAFSKHSGVIAKFGELFAKPGKVPREYHRYLIQAEEARTKADYDAASVTSCQEAEQQIKRAELFIELAHTHL
jgi:uncharacterized protein (UPF0332 family)